MLKRIAYETDYQHRCLRLGWSFLRKNFIHCNLQVTYRCDFKCQICDFWKTDHSPAEELTLENIRLIGEKLRRLGTMIVSLGGGEPLIREDLYRIVGAIRNAGHFPILITNGWNVNESVAKDILRAGLQEISVSVDYADPAKHDAMRGRPGAWERSIRALELLRKHRPDSRQRIHMISVLMKDNLDEIEPMIRLSRELGVTYMLNLYSTGRGAKESRQPDGQVTARLLDLKKKYPEFVTLTSYIERFDHAIAHGGIGDCQGGTLFLNIGSRGEVSRCIDTLDESVGNILTDDIREIAGKLERLRFKRPCGECWTSCRGFAECMYLPPRLRQFKEFCASVRGV
ncbi:MAG: radical SAM protein [Elusimicrobiota bacterium]|jgi:MoaA/NifB/PqqE/SkfB family radical SAM enzyme